MAADLDTLMVRLRELARAHERLSTASPDPRRAAAAADEALARVLTLLDDPKIAGPLREMIPPARDRVVHGADDFRTELRRRRPELNAIEAAVTRRLGTTPHDIQRLHSAYERAHDRRQQFPDSIDQLKERLRTLHEAIKTETAASRTLSRAHKKTRKRKLGQAVASAIFGTGVIAANTQLPALFAFSYGLGGGALHQALRDIVGESGD